MAEINHLRQSPPSLDEVERKGFPVLGSQGAKVDWQFVADHGKQAQANHYQTVERLAERGGLSWTELAAVIEDRKWCKMSEADAISVVRAAEARYLAALSPAPDARERERIEVHKIETVAGDFYTEPGEPIWRIILNGYCADFPSEQAARNFADQIERLGRHAGDAE